jgi:hypothetical protein
MATDWSITHSPTLRYLSTHLPTSLFSPEIFSDLKLGLGNPEVGSLLALLEDGSQAAGRVEQRRERAGRDIGNSREAGRALHSSQEGRDCGNNYHQQRYGAR